MLVGSCKKDDAAPDATSPEIALKSNTLAGGPYEFVMDAVTDQVKDLKETKAKEDPENQKYLIVHQAKDSIAKIVSTFDELLKLDFEEFNDFEGDAINYDIYHVAYKKEAKGVEEGEKLTAINGEHEVSNAITVKLLRLKAAKLLNYPSPTSFPVIDKDGIADYFTREKSRISYDAAGAVGKSKIILVVYDLKGTGIIVKQLNTIEDFEKFDVDTLEEDKFYPTHAVAYGKEELVAEGQDIASDDFVEKYIDKKLFVLGPLFGFFLDEFPKAGTLVGGPYEFTIDAKADFVTDIDVTNVFGREDNKHFLVVNKTTNTIIRVLNTLDELRKVDFNAFKDFTGTEAIYDIYHLGYARNGNAVGLKEGNLLTALSGRRNLSLPISVKLLKP